MGWTPILSLALSFFLLSSTAGVRAPVSRPEGSTNYTTASSFRPSMAAVIAVLSILFSLTFFLLVYGKFCHSSNYLFRHDLDLLQDAHVLSQSRSRSRFSGVDRTIVESLPFFRFSSLRGCREGLECAVCLSRFESDEILRMLPKCKHAFHIVCVDRWLESHSSCPICRCKVEIVDDQTFFPYSNSLCGNSSVLRNDPNVDILIHRERDRGEGSSSRYGSFMASSVRNKLLLKKEKRNLLIQPTEEGGRDDERFLHKFKHRIIISDVMFKSRWSDFSSTDLMSLNFDMLSAVSRERFSSSRVNTDGHAGKEKNLSANETILKIREDMEKKRSIENKISRLTRSIPGPGVDHQSYLPDPVVNSTADITHSSSLSIPIQIGGKRSMSEITKLSRFAESESRNCRRSDTGDGQKEERLLKLWLPIARRTVNWSAGRETRSQSRHSPVSHPDQ